MVPKFKIYAVMRMICTWSIANCPYHSFLLWTTLFPCDTQKSLVDIPVLLPAIALYQVYVLIFNLKGCVPAVSIFFFLFSLLDILFLLPVVEQTVLSLGLNVCLWWDVSDIVSTVCISSPFFTKSWLSLDFVATPRPWTRFEAKMGRNNIVNWKSFIWSFIITLQHLCPFLLEHLNNLRGWELAYFRMFCPLQVFFRIQ